MDGLTLGSGSMGLTTTYTYDALGRLLLVDYPNDPDTTYTYDLLGWRLTMTNAAGTATWTYDPVTGQPATVDGPFDDNTMAYTWDAAGHRIDTTLSDDPNVCAATWSPSPAWTLGQGNTATTLVRGRRHAVDGTPRSSRHGADVGVAHVSGNHHGRSQRKSPLVTGIGSRGYVSLMYPSCGTPSRSTGQHS